MSKLSIAISKLKSYPCTGCGSCCKRLDVSVSNIERFSQYYNIPVEELLFPYKYDNTGRCEMLDENNRCKVYENRPNLCNIEWWTKRVKDNRDDFFLQQINACNRLMDEDNIDKSFRIVL